MKPVIGRSETSLRRCGASITSRATPLNVTMIKISRGQRDPRYADSHDAIYASLDKIHEWMIYGHLSFTNDFQQDETIRLKKFHLLIRDLAKRFTGSRDLDAIGWFLKQEGTWSGKRFHFHFAISRHNLENTTPETVARYLTKQWQKIGKSVCEIRPWDATKTAKGIWYLTQNEDRPLHHSKYFHGELCHWKMSPLLFTKILAIAKREATPATMELN